MIIHPITAFIVGITITIILVYYLIKYRDEEEMRKMKLYRFELSRMKEEIESNNHDLNMSFGKPPDFQFTPQRQYQSEEDDAEKFENLLARRRSYMVTKKPKNSNFSFKTPFKNDDSMKLFKGLDISSVKKRSGFKFED